VSEAKPYSKEAQLARGERRYRRKVASPKQWQAIIAAKRGPCRISAQMGAPVGAVEYHHLVPRDLGGDDVADNIVPLCSSCHARVTGRQPIALRLLAQSLTDAEYAYVIGKVGEDAMERLFGIRYGR
jgi:5-methylcytosine-specific restriction endonuclease McrA